MKMENISWLASGFLLGWSLQWLLGYWYFSRRGKKREQPLSIAPKSSPETAVAEQKEAVSASDKEAPSLVTSEPPPRASRAFNMSAPAIEPPSLIVHGDDLSLIRGIGPTYALYLQKAGITTFNNLAKQDPISLVETMRGDGITGIGVKLVSNWIHAAKELGQAAGEAARGNDDLTLIHGIGPVYSLRLQKAGIHSFRELAGAAVEQLAEAVHPPTWMRVDYESWIRQAKALAGLLPANDK